MLGDELSGLARLLDDLVERGAGDDDLHAGDVVTRADDELCVVLSDVFNSSAEIRMRSVQSRSEHSQ